MPRAKQANKKQTQTPQAKLLSLPVDPETLMPDINIRSNKPGAKDYDPDKDSMIVGFRLGSSMTPSHLGKDLKVEDVTPYHFLTDPATGLRPGMTTPPSGGTKLDLSSSITQYNALPPVAIWRAGDWMSNLVWTNEFKDEEMPQYIQTLIEKSMLDWPKTGVPWQIADFFVVSGEGTPGNYYYRVYEVPREIAKTTENVPHPLLWKKEDFDTGLGYSGGGGGYTWGATKPAISGATVTKAPALPAGVRIRCSCGHWFKESDLSGHVQVCAVTSKGEADWAMMCAPECGCVNLDEASTPKPGFPRPKAEEKPAEAEPEKVPAA